MSHPQPKCMCGATALGEGHMHPDSAPPAPKGRGGPARAGGSEGWYTPSLDRPHPMGDDPWDINAPTKTQARMGTHMMGVGITRERGDHGHPCMG